MLLKMAAREPSRYLARTLPRSLAPSARAPVLCCRRNASDEAPARRLSEHLDDLESASSLTTTVAADAAKSFDPVARASARKIQLPPSRYVIHIQPLSGPGSRPYSGPHRELVDHFVQRLTPLSPNTTGINSDPRNTTGVLFILTNPRPPQTHPRDSSCRAPSRYPEYSRPTSRPWHLTF